MRQFECVKQLWYNRFMNSATQRTVLIVEDDPDWQKSYIRQCKEMGWKYKAFNRVQDALAFLEQNAVMFDVAIVDKGGSNARRGGRDLIGHRDGLTVLRRIKELQPFCARVLSTGEYWNEKLFDDPTLKLHAFVDKGWWAENREALFQQLASWESPPDLRRPVLFTSDSFPHGKETW